MKYMIRCDIEGASGVVSYDQAEPGGPEYDCGQRMFMSDLLALVEGLRAGGAEEVVIYDEHYYGRSIDLDRLPPYASAICGKSPYRPDWAGGLDGTFAGLALLGFHSMAGTPGGLLPHTYELDIAQLRLNGVVVGEIGMEAAIAGDWGVPTVIVVGDSAGIREAEQLLPGVVGVVVKESVSEAAALCYPLSVTAPRIREAAEAAVRAGSAAAPWHLPPPVKLEVELREGPYREAVRELFSAALSDPHTLLIEGGSATEVWANYWQKKLQAQQLVSEKGAGA